LAWSKRTFGFTGKSIGKVETTARCKTILNTKLLILLIRKRQRGFPRATFQLFGKRLSPIDLMDAPTIRQLANLLYDDSPVVKSKILIRFNNLSKGIPLVCVHAGNLDALYFRFLASHFSDRPVIALQSRGLDGEEKTLSSISDIAEDYLNEISRVLGSPLHPDSFSCDLVGYCLGTSVALERFSHPTLLGAQRTQYPIEAFKKTLG